MPVWNTSNILKQNLGLSLVEALVSIGIATIVMLGTGGIISELNKSHSVIGAKSDADQFMSSISKFLLDDQTCGNALKNNIFPNATPVPFTIKGFSGYGANSNVDISSGYVVTPRLSISSLNISSKGTANTIIYKNGIPFNRSILLLDFGFSITTDEIVPTLQHKYLELPVLVDTKGKIENCYVEMSPQDACVTSGGTYNGSVCTPATSCNFTGMLVACLPDANCTATSYPLAKKINISYGAQPAPSGSCTGGSPTYTGSVSYTYQVGSGKNAYAAPNTAYFYMCLKCN